MYLLLSSHESIARGGLNVKHTGVPEPFDRILNFYSSKSSTISNSIYIYIYINRHIYIYMFKVFFFYISNNKLSHISSSSKFQTTMYSS